MHQRKHRVAPGACKVGVQEVADPFLPVGTARGTFWVPCCLKHPQQKVVQEIKAIKIGLLFEVLKIARGRKLWRRVFNLS